MNFSFCVFIVLLKSFSVSQDVVVTNRLGNDAKHTKEDWII